MTCRCKELRAALMEAKAEVEAAVEKLAETGFCSVKLGYRLREKWAQLIKETSDVQESSPEAGLSPDSEGKPVDVPET